MKRKTEINYVDKLWRKMRRKLKSFVKTQSADDLHDFRVQVKKLRAFITLAESAEKQVDFKKPFKPVKRLFKKAGEIRTAGLNIALAQNNDVEANIIDQQIKLRDVAVAEFIPFARKMLNKLKSAQHKFERKIKPIGKLHINMFYLENLKQLGEELSRVHFDESLHTSRKKLKVLLYDYPLTAPVLKLNFNAKYIDGVQEKIGNWHDIEDARNLLQKEGLPLKAISQTDKKLRNGIKTIVKDLFTKATTVTDVPLPQLS